MLPVDSSDQTSMLQVGSLAVKLCVPADKFPYWIPYVASTQKSCAEGTGFSCSTERFFEKGSHFRKRGIIQA